MSTATIQPPHLSPDELKLARRLSRRKGLFAPDLLKAALARAFVMLRPDILWKNPVMFTVEVDTALSVVYTIYKAVDPGSTLATLGYLPLRAGIPVPPGVTSAANLVVVSVDPARIVAEITRRKAGLAAWAKAARRER